MTTALEKPKEAMDAAGKALDLVEQVRALKEQCGAEVRRRETAEAMVSKRNAEVDRLKREAGGAREMQEMHIEHIGGLVAKLHDREADVDALKKEVDRLKSELSKLTGGIADEWSKRRDTEAEAASQRARADALMKELDEAKNRGAELGRVLETTLRQRNMAWEKSQEDRYRAEALQAQVESLRAELADRNRSAEAGGKAASPEGRSTWAIGFEGARIAESRRHGEMVARIAAMSPSPAQKTGRWKCRRCGKELLATAWTGSGSRWALSPESGFWIHWCEDNLASSPSDRIGDAPTEPPAKEPPKRGRWRCPKCAAEADAPRNRAVLVVLGARPGAGDWFLNKDDGWLHRCYCASEYVEADRIGDAPEVTP